MTRRPRLHTPCLPPAIRPSLGERDSIETAGVRCIIDCPRLFVINQTCSNLQDGKDHAVAMACEGRGQHTVTVAIPQGKSLPLTVMVPPFQLMGVGITPVMLGSLPWAALCTMVESTAQKMRMKAPAPILPLNLVMRAEGRQQACLRKETQPPLAKIQFLLRGRSSRHNLFISWPWRPGPGPGPPGSVRTIHHLRARLCAPVAPCSWCLRWALEEEVHNMILLIKRGEMQM